MVSFMIFTASVQKILDQPSYNNMFTHTYIYYSEGKSNLNNKNEIDKHNNKHLTVVYLFIHRLFNIQCHRMLTQ